MMIWNQSNVWHGDCGFQWNRQSKAAADYVAQSNEEDGVARFVEQMILGK